VLSKTYAEAVAVVCCLFCVFTGPPLLYGDMAHLVDVVWNDRASLTASLCLTARGIVVRDERIILEFFLVGGGAVSRLTTFLIAIQLQLFVLSPGTSIVKSLLLYILINSE